FCSAVRTTLVGSMMPALIKSSYSSVCALNPKAPFASRTFSSTTEPSCPALRAIQRSGSSSARRTMLTPACASSSSLSASSAPLDVGLLAGAVDQRRVVLIDYDPLAAAELLQRDVLEFQPELLGDQAAAGEDRDVLEHGLAPVAEAGRFHRAAGERAPNLVDDQRCQRLALDLLRDDEERLPGAHHLLEQREQVLHDRDLLLVDEEVGVLEHRLHPVDVGHEVGGEVAAVELHALDDLELRSRL